MSEPPKTLLKMLVDQRQWTFDVFATRFAEVAADVVGRGARNPTVGESQFRRWTSGRLKGLPTRDACRVLEALFGVPANALFSPPDAGSRSHTYNLESEIAMTARDAQNDASEAAALSISEMTLEQLDHDVVSLARGYDTFTKLEVLERGRKAREQAEYLRERTNVPAQQQQLLILAGQSAALLSSAAFDLGSMDSATRLARTAALYAEAARFDPLRAHAHGTLAYIAYFGGESSRAVNLAQQALAFKGLGKVAVRRLRAIEARAHGYRGDVESALRCIQLAEEVAVDHGDELHEDVGGEFGFTTDRLAMSNSSTALLCGDAAQAEAFAQRALLLVSRRSEHERPMAVLGGAAIDLATARLMSEDLHGAREALATLWTVPSAQRVTGLLLRAQGLRRGLAQHYRGASVARELAERIEHFVHGSAQHQLGTGKDLAVIEP